MHENWDVIVIGAGPAGCAASTILAQHGRKVLLLEKEKFPRYHIGESLIPFCYFPLERIGLVDRLKGAGYVQKHSVQFVATDGAQSQPFYFSDHLDHECSVSWQVDRASFDQLLLDNARERGVHAIEQVAVKNVVEQDGAVIGVTAVAKDGAQREFRAPVTMDCTGRDGLMMKRKGWRMPEPGLDKTAVWTYFKGSKRDVGRDEGATTIAYLPAKGWFWHIPLANDLVSVGAVADKDYLFADTRDLETIIWREIEKNPWIKDRVSTGQQCHGYHAAADYSYRSRHCAKDGVVLAGDAFAFLDPVFSSGVFLALTTAELAADAVNRCFETNDFSAAQFDNYAEKVRYGLEVMRKFVYAFYDLDFNFKSLIKKHPHLHGDLTDCLIGNVYKDLGPLFKAIGEFAKLPATLPYGKPLVPAMAEASA